MNTLVRALLPLLLAAPAALALHDPEPDRGHDVVMSDILRAVELRLERGAIFRPQRLIVLDGPRAAVIPIPNPVPVRDEHRVDLRFIPVIGGLFQPTASRDFRGAPRVGRAWAAGDAVVIGPDAPRAPGLADGVRMLVIANRDVSYQLAVDFAAPGATSPGEPPAMDGLVPIGAVHRMADALLVTISPSIVDISD